MCDAEKPQRGQMSVQSVTSLLQAPEKSSF